MVVLLWREASMWVVSNNMLYRFLFVENVPYNLDYLAKGNLTFKILNPITAEFMLYILSKDLLPCNSSFIDLEINLNILL